MVCFIELGWAPATGFPPKFQAQSAPNDNPPPVWLELIDGLDGLRCLQKLFYYICYLCVLLLFACACVCGVKCLQVELFRLLKLF